MILASKRARPHVYIGQTQVLLAFPNKPILKVRKRAAQPRKERRKKYHI